MHELEKLRTLFARMNEGQVDLTKPVALSDYGVEWHPLLEELNRFLGSTADTLRVVDDTLDRVSIKEALHVLQIRRLSAIVEEQSADIERLGVTLEELAQGITQVAEDSQGAADATEQMEAAGLRGLEVLQRALTEVQSLESQARGAQEAVSTLVTESRLAGEGLQTIRRVVSTTEVLAINAAIQAARANDPAFGVVAQEMRRLADQITRIVKDMEPKVQRMETAGQRAADGMSTMALAAEKTGEEATVATDSMERIRTEIRAVSGGVTAIAAVAEEQAAATESMAAVANELTGRVGEVRASIALTKDLAAADWTERTQVVLGRYRIGSRLDQRRELLEGLAGSVEAILEERLQAGAVRESDLWDTGYQEIKGAAIAGLNRLFRVDLVPKEGFAPPKYRTAYDHKVDMPLIDLLDRHFAQDHLVYATVADLNGFVVAMPRALARDWTGNPEQDLLHNRIKRIFNDAQGLRGARAGLPESLASRPLITRQDLEQHGALLAGETGMRTFRLQTYARDSGDVVRDLAMPVIVRGKRWGTVRIGYLPEQDVRKG